jgi:hypothetical protein
MQTKPVKTVKTIKINKIPPGIKAKMEVPRSTHNKLVIARVIKKTVVLGVGGLRFAFTGVIWTHLTKLVGNFTCICHNFASIC